MAGEVHGEQYRKSPWLNWGAPAPKFGWWMSALTIDPANSDHLMFATGQLYATSNLSAPMGDGPGSGPYWDVEAQASRSAPSWADQSDRGRSPVERNGRRGASSTTILQSRTHDDDESDFGTGTVWIGRANPKLMVRTGNTRPFGATSADAEAHGRRSGPRCGRR